MTYTATYSPDDNKLRLYAAMRLDEETYARVKAAGFRWAPQQKFFFAPAWSPAREDLLLALAGEIGDEDTSLSERAEERAERFEGYREKRTEDYERAQAAVASIADNIPLGQPILVGHHSEKRARKDAERIENGMRRAVKMWDTAEYWKDRARGAIRHAKYKERPDVRARRIKGLEAEQRKVAKSKTQAEQAITIWRGLTEPDSKWFKLTRENQPTTFAERALFIAGNTNTTAYGTYSDLTAGKITAEEAQARTIAMNERSIAHCDRWLVHLANRLEYERTMLGESGGTIADRTKPEKGGAVQSLWAPRGGWAYIQKVNKVTVTILHSWGNEGGRTYSQKVAFDKLRGVMSAAEVAAARERGAIQETGDGIGFYLMQSREEFDRTQGGTSPSPETAQPAAAPAVAADTKADVAKLREAIKAGVQVVSAPQLFPTPVDLADRMVALAELREGDRVLEPSAGTGRLIDAILKAEKLGHVVAVEIRGPLAHRLHTTYSRRRTPPAVEVLTADFLSCNGNMGLFDRIVMNPPFSGGADVKHIKHALTMLGPEGRLVALCANGPRQQAELQPLATAWIPLEGAFEEAGTGVNVALMVIDK